MKTTNVPVKVVTFSDLQLTVLSDGSVKMVTLRDDGIITTDLDELNEALNELKKGYYMRRFCSGSQCPTEPCQAKHVAEDHAMW